MQQRQRLNWGIAAAGRITHDFVTALSTIEGDKHAVVAVADVDLTRAQEFAQRHQILRAYDGFDALSLDANVDVVYVGTLNPFHYTVTRLMLERNKNVLCEAPICLTFQQATVLYRLAELRGVFLMEGMWSRFFPSYRRLHELLKSGSVGDVTMVQVRHGFPAARVERIWTRALGGSITLDIGLCALQLGQLVFGVEPVSIKAHGKLNTDRVDVQSKIILDYGQNRKLVAVISGMEQLENCASIVGTKGEIKLSNYWCCTQITEPSGAIDTWPLPSANAEFHHINACGLRYEAEEVHKCIRKRLLESPLYTHAESLQLIKIESEIRRQLGVSYEDVISNDL